jgi:hypothetical protein
VWDGHDSLCRTAVKVNKELLDRCKHVELVAREYEKALRFYAEFCDVMYSPEQGAPPLEDAWYVAREALKNFTIEWE